MYNMDKKTAKLPISFIKNFDIKHYDAEKVYKVFWSRDLHGIQNVNNPVNLKKLRDLQEPPSKEAWNTANDYKC